MTTIDENKARLASTWATIGRPAEYPLETAAAIYMLTVLGYDVDRKKLEYFWAAGYVDKPAVLLGRLAWGESNILDHADALERRRQWAPFNAIHYSKWSDAERAKHARSTPPASMTLAISSQCPTTRSFA